MQNRRKKYVFLDRDGTIIHHVHHLHSKSQVKWVEGLSETLNILQGLGFLFALVTNQSVIARGVVSPKKVDELNKFILQPLETVGILFQHILVCPHSEEDGCGCRKPKPGLVEQLIDKEEIDFPNSFMVGDQETDIVFGKNLMMKTIRISETKAQSKADFIVNGLSEIVTIIANSLG